MKTNEKVVLVEAKKMLGRIELFKNIYDFSNQFINEADKLTEIVNDYENGKNKDIKVITKSFDTFSKRYKDYVQSFQKVS